DLSVHVVDPYGRLTPAGVAGEMMVGGDGVSRGYLARPALTASRFVPNPFTEEPGGRLYRSGDLARHSTRGGMDYVGRSDNQVKIRGFRIELGEIEAVLSLHPSVNQCVVALTQGASGDRLAAFVLRSGSEPAPATAELRSFLATRLPDYMIPAGFVFLDELPLTANGKLDRGALPALPLPSLTTASDQSSTLSELESSLTSIWQTVLGLPRVGQYDNFFELGGDSILAIQIVSKAKAAGLKFTPKDVFECQTVAVLAANLELAPAEASGTHADAQGGLFALTPIQQWFFDQKSPDSHHFNHALVLEIKEGQSESGLARAFATLIGRHDSLRLRFLDTPDGWRQEVISPNELSPFIRYDFSSLPAEQLESDILAASNELQRSLDPFSGRLAKAAYFDLGPGRPHRLLIVIHHLGVDAVSWRILVEEFQVILKLIEAEKPIELTASAASFAEWARALAAYAKSETVQSELGFWLAQTSEDLARIPSDLDPRSNQGGLNVVSSSGTVVLSLGFDETKSLLYEVPKAYRTQISDVLLTALVLTWFSVTGKRSVLVALEGHGREDVIEGLDLTQTVGWFTAIYPVLLTGSEPVDLATTLKSVKETLRAIPNGGLGYGLLRHCPANMEAGERLLQLPQPEVVFNYLGQFGQPSADSGLSWSATAASGATQSPNMTRPFLLEVNGGVYAGKLTMRWTYSSGIHRASTVENLARS
ncbi:MAG TPA: condensation domain-containing protein, partial [Blastocatellia bacterium]